MVLSQPSKLMTRVRFPYSAPWKYSTAVVHRLHTAQVSSSNLLVSTKFRPIRIEVLRLTCNQLTAVRFCHWAPVLSEYRQVVCHSLWERDFECSIHSTPTKSCIVNSGVECPPYKWDAGGSNPSRCTTPV